MDAMADRERIFDFIANDNPWAALAIDEKLVVVEGQLKAFPQSGRTGRANGTRELVVRGTPYILVYEVRSEVISVLRVIHGAQQWPESD